MPTQFALDLQLLGGVWMIQIFPALVLGLFTRWFSGWALFVGWAVGIDRRHGVVVDGTKAWAPVHELAWDIPLRRPRRQRPRLRRLQRPDGGAAQFRRGGAAVAGDALEGAGRDEAGGLSGSRGARSRGQVAALAAGTLTVVPVFWYCRVAVSRIALVRPCSSVGASRSRQGADVRIVLVELSRSAGDGGGLMLATQVAAR